jgi:hypothetical protein
MIKLNKTYFIEKIFPGITLKYEFYADELYCDRAGIRIRYRMFSTFFGYREIPLAAWSGNARDNLDNNYVCTGEVHNISSDESHLEGVISFLPLLTQTID